VVIAPHAGPFAPGETIRRADSLLAPTPVVYQGIHRGTRPPEGSFLTLALGENGPNVTVSAIKHAEDGKGVVLRLRETDGIAAKGSLSGALVGGSFPFSLRPHQIQTLRFDGKGPPRKTNFLEK
jgi:alpha-mannosidase